ncbi:MAG: hypothetical protein JW881_21430 [Spirochaetales bacterium]|nr:hypothetical protein [Spirochaetales bacterium]
MTGVQAAETRLQWIYRNRAADTFIPLQWSDIWIHNKEKSNLYGTFTKEIENRMEKRNTGLPFAYILHEAAEAASRHHNDEICSSSAYVGIMPGSFDPVHYGHITAALNAVVQLKLDGVLFLIGGTVPEKPEITAFRHRLHMAQVYANDKWGTWIRYCPLRFDMAEIYKAALWPLPSSLKQGAVSGTMALTIIRNITDIAAFCLLFAMNPRVQWVYITGSDKINKYGNENEKELVLHTLFKHGIQVFYSNRKDFPIDLNLIGKQRWLLDLWNGGMFIADDLTQNDRVSSSKIRHEIACDTPLVEQEIHPEVLHYIRRSGIGDLYRFRDMIKSGRIKKNSKEYTTQLSALYNAGLVDCPGTDM